MGEKYDDCYDDGPGRIQVLTALPRMRDPSGPGFPPDEYNTMRGWGEQGRAAFQRYDQRRVVDIQQMCADATQRLAGAGADPASRLAAGQDIVERLNSGQRDLELHGAQSQMTLSMLDHEGTIPTSDLVDEARASARQLKKAVNDNVGPLEQLLADTFANVRDRAVNAAGAHVEEAVNRIGQTAYTSTAQLYGAVRRRGLIDPDAGSDAGPA
jgi:hypothetical protein